MNRFIDQVEDDGLAERLDRAIRGRGAFRWFKDILFEHAELRGAWFRFSDDRQRGRAREWLAMQGYHPQREALDDHDGGRAPGGA